MTAETVGIGILGFGGFGLFARSSSRRCRV